MPRYTPTTIARAMATGVACVALSGCALLGAIDGGATNDSHARAGALQLGFEVQIHLVDNNELPTLNVVAQELLVDGAVTQLQPLPDGSRLPNPWAHGVVFHGYASGSTTTDWCVWVSHPEGDEAQAPGFQYTVDAGLERGDCT